MSVDSLTLFADFSLKMRGSAPGFVDCFADYSAADCSADYLSFVRCSGSVIRWHTQRPADVTEHVADAAPHDTGAWLVRVAPRRVAHLLPLQLPPDGTGL